MRPGRIGRPLLELVRKPANGDVPCRDCEPHDYFRDAPDHVRRMDAMTVSLRGCLASVLKCSNLVEKQRTGIVTAQLGCLGRDPRGSCRKSRAYKHDLPAVAVAAATGGYPVVLPVTAMVRLGFCRRVNWPALRA